jgi:hypothetical protein
MVRNLGYPDKYPDFCSFWGVRKKFQNHLLSELLIRLPQMKLFRHSHTWDYKRLLFGLYTKKIEFFGTPPTKSRCFMSALCLYLYLIVLILDVMILTGM